VARKGKEIHGRAWHDKGKAWKIKTCHHGKERHAIMAWKVNSRHGMAWQGKA
jgi:hypothetical protein